MECLHTRSERNSNTVADRLGYPHDAKLIIIHADDLGLAHSVNEASFLAMDRRIISSASVMVPCPWFVEVVEYAKEHPDADFGLHLTLTSEWKYYRWGPVAAKTDVPSLLDSSGYFWPDAISLAAHADPDHVEIEIRAQIERALQMGLAPTHLDTHMFALFTTEALFATFAKLSREYKMPFLTLPDRRSSGLLMDDDIAVSAILQASLDVRAERWDAAYVSALKSLTPGLTELIVHLGYDDAELKGIAVDHSPWGASWRQRDLEVLLSQQFQETLEANDIRLVGWRDIKSLQADLCNQPTTS